LASPEARPILSQEWVQLWDTLGLAPISKEVFLEELAVSLLSNEKMKDWDSYAPRYERIQWIIKDLRSLKVDPKAEIRKPSSFPNTPAVWKHKLKQYEFEEITLLDGSAGGLLFLTNPKLYEDRAAMKEKLGDSALGNRYEIRPCVGAAEFWYHLFCESHAVEDETGKIKHYNRDDTFSRITARHVHTMKKDFVSALIARCPHESCRENINTRRRQMEVMAGNPKGARTASPSTSGQSVVSSPSSSSKKRRRSKMEGEAAPVEGKRQRRPN
jgi:hypothetical protein